MAKRDEPPIEAFVEIVRKIKLEPVLALAIQSFARIDNTEILGRLKQSDELLDILCGLARSGETDLIRWSAAHSIVTINFDFIAISERLTEMPSITVGKIVESKKKILIDFDANTKPDKKFTDRDDYNDYVNFWVYGPTFDLRVLTAQHSSDSSKSIVFDVVKRQNVYGIKEINKLLQKLESSQDLELVMKHACENELFEQYTHLLSVELLKGNNIADYAFANALINQGHLLQSNNSQFRLTSSSILMNADEDRVKKVKSFDSGLLLVAEAINFCKFDLNRSFSYEDMVYEDLKDVVNIVRIAVNMVSRDNVRKYLTQYLKKLSGDLDRLSPGFTWKQIKVAKELQWEKEKAEADRRAAEKAKEERAEADRRAAAREKKQKEEAAEKARQAKVEADRQAAVRAQQVKTEADRQAAVRAQQAKAEADRQAAVRAQNKKDEAKRQVERNRETTEKVVKYFGLGIIAIIFLYPIFLCLGAYFTNSKIMSSSPPLAAFLAGMIMGPISLFVSVLMLLILGYACIFGSGCDYNTQSNIGQFLIIFFGSALTTPAYLQTK